MSSAQQAYSFTSGQRSSSMLFSEALHELQKLTESCKVTKHVTCYPWLTQGTKQDSAWMLLLYEKADIHHILKGLKPLS